MARHRRDAVFAALADPTRRDLLRTVVEQGPCTATELADGRPITRQAIMKHLGVLGDAGLVHRDRDGRSVRYRADTAPLGEVSEWITTTGAAWDRRLGALQNLLGSGRPASGRQAAADTSARPTRPGATEPAAPDEARHP